MSAAHQSVFGNFRRFAKLAALPFVLTLALAWIEIPVAAAVPFSAVAFLILDLIPFAILGVALNRTILTGAEAGILPSPLLGRRTWLYLGYSILLLLLILVPIIVMVIGAAGAAFESQQANGSIWLILAGILGFLILLYVLMRLSLVFPAVSVDEKLGFRGSWRLTKGNGLKLFAIFPAIVLFVALAAIVGSMILGENIHFGIGGGINIAPDVYESWSDIVLKNAPAQIWGTLVSYTAFGLFTGAYTSAYTQLSGWGAPRAEILERFD